MQEVKEKKIGDNTYKVRPLGAKEGRRVLARLVQVLGGGVAGLIGASNGGGKDAAFAGIESFAKNLTEDQLDFFCDVFAPLTQLHKADGKAPQLKDVFDEHFAANYWEMCEWLFFCLEVNFGSFLGGNGTLKGLLVDSEKPAQ